MPRIGHIRFFGRRSDDRGGVATIVAILLASGMLMGLGAIVVDVGQLYGEREELQSSADSAAMAVALDCAYKRTECSTANGTGKTYANANSKDGLSALKGNVCGTDTALPACGGGSTGNLSDCLGTVPANANYVEVRTKTEVKPGDYVLPYSFAQTLTGVGKGQTVGACARVGYGSPNGGFALTFSVCEYSEALANSQVVTGTPVPSDEVELYTHSHPSANKCKEGPSGSNLPGGFGWTDHNSVCMTTIGAGGTYGSDTGNGTPSDCKSVLEDIVANKTPVAIPIFKDVTGNGSNGTYTLKGFAAFVVTGWYLPGISPKTKKSWLTGDSVCSGNDDCIYGYFTKAVVDWDGSFGNTTSLGAIVVKTIG